MRLKEVTQQVRSILFNGLAAEIMCLVLQVLVIMYHSYSTRGSDSAQEYQQFARNVRHLAGPLITLAVVFLFSLRACRKADSRLPLKGSLVGVVAAATGIAAMYLLRGNPELFLVLSVSISISAGYLGGLFVQGRRLRKPTTAVENSVA